MLEQGPTASPRTLPGCGPAYAGGRLLRIAADERRVLDDRDRTVVPAGVGSIRPAGRGGRRRWPSCGSRRRRAGRSRCGATAGRTGRPDLQRSGQPNDLRIARDGATALVRLRGPQEWALYRTRRAGSLDAIGREGVREGAFSPDGRYVAVVVASGIVIVDAGRLAPLAAFEADAKELAWLA